MSGLHRHTRALLLAALGLLTVAVLAALIALRVPHPAPKIQGQWLPTPVLVRPFTLIDHHQQDFTREQLVGHWHLLVYGYTYCPDICPITLSLMATLIERLAREQQLGDTRVLFYSVDPERDSPELLARYVPYFHPDFVGLTVADQSAGQHRPFEQSLGIVYDIPRFDRYGTAYGPDDNYPVNHGVSIYVLNPEAALQAVLTPAFDERGLFYFSLEQLYSDYLAVRHYRLLSDRNQRAR